MLLKNMYNQDNLKNMFCKMKSQLIFHVVFTIMSGLGTLLLAVKIRKKYFSDTPPPPMQENANPPPLPSCLT